MKTALTYEKELDAYQKLSREINKNPYFNFDFFSKFKVKGKQGIAGIVRIGNVGYSVFKISQYADFLIEHEYNIMKSLNVLSEYCPHFCKSYALRYLKVPSDYLSLPNPFTSQKDSSTLEISVMFMEYIEKSKKFYNLICDPSISEDILYSTIKQVLLAILFAQRYRFTHYDLHSSNILMRECEKNSVFLYLYDNNNAFAVPTHGYYPVIIDFGFSHIQDMKNKYCYASMGHTDIGFTSSIYDPISDPKLFLITTSSEIEGIRGESDKGITFSNVVNNIFSRLNIDFSCGWDNVEEMSASDIITSYVEKEGRKSVLFSNKSYIIIDGVISLITLPFKQKEIRGLVDAFKIMIGEFIKIENEIESKSLQAYIFHEIISSAREVYSLYLKKETRNKAVIKFQNLLFEKINNTAKFCNPKGLNVEKLLCSLFLFSQCVEGVLYEYLTLLQERKQKEYSNLPLKTISQIYGAIDINLPDDSFVYDNETRVYVWDNEKKKRNNFILTKGEAEKMNSYDNHLRGAILSDIYYSRDKKQVIIEKEEEIIEEEKDITNAISEEEKEEKEEEKEQKEVIIKEEKKVKKPRKRKNDKFANLPTIG